MAENAITDRPLLVDTEFVRNIIIDTPHRDLVEAEESAMCRMKNDHAKLGEFVADIVIRQGKQCHIDSIEMTDYGEFYDHFPQGFYRTRFKITMAEDSND